jgi:chemotaxis signal transduction protein
MRRSFIAWDEVRTRLQADEKAAREVFAESPERIKTVFHQRAIRLARAPARNKPVSRGFPALIFSVAQEQYAIELKDLAEVLPFQGCTPVPGSSPDFPGVINLRGELRPVIDLGQVLCGTPSTGPGALLVLPRPLALNVDSVDDLRELDSGELARAARGGYVRTLAPGIPGLLDVEALLSAVLSPKGSR